MLKRILSVAALLLCAPCFGANEAYKDYATGNTIYAVINKQNTGQAWNTTGTPAFGSYLPLTSTRGDFDIAATESGSGGRYFLTIPAGAANTDIAIQWFIQSGGSPAASDLEISTTYGHWDGTTFYADRASARLLPYMQLALRKDAAASSDLATAKGEINENTGTGTGGFDPTQDSQQALRDDIPGDIAVESVLSQTQLDQILAALSVSPSADIGVHKSLTATVKRIDGAFKAVAPIVKPAGDEVEILVDFRPVLAASDAIDDEGINSITLVTGEGLESPAFDDVDQAELWMNSGVKFTITDGEDGEDYGVRVSVTTVKGDTYTPLVTVQVRDD